MALRRVILSGRFMIFQKRTGIVSALKNNPNVRKALDENSLMNIICLLKNEIIKKDEEIFRLQGQKSSLNVIEQIESRLNTRIYYLEKKEEKLNKFEDELKERELKIIANKFTQIP